MFGVGFRTPAKANPITADSDSLPEALRVNVEKDASPVGSLVEKEKDSLTKVRRSIGEWESGRTCPTSKAPSSPAEETTVVPSKQKPKVTLSQGGAARGTMMTVAGGSLGLATHTPKGRVAEAKACLVKAKLQLNSSRNLKAEIRTDVIQAVERLYRLVKEAEYNNPLNPSSIGRVRDEQEVQTAKPRNKDSELELELARRLEEHGKLLRESTEQMAILKRQMEKREESRPATYASVAATSTSQPVHSIVVSSADAEDTSEDVIAKIRTAVNAKASGIRVDRLRKAREGKVVLGCQSSEELAKIAEKLKLGQPALLIEKKENRDPQVILKNVLAINTDEDILAALRRQNAHTLGEIPEGDYRAVVRYRRKARNPHECHVVLRVSPRVWQCLTSVGRVHVDLQRIQVSDQSPLLQCTKCLGFGHGKRHCTEADDLCSHCAEPHLRKDCPHWEAGAAPKCRNCILSKLDKSSHNAFDSECPTRKKWDRLARSSVAYC